jgi:adenosine deaminase
MSVAEGEVDNDWSAAEAGPIDPGLRRALLARRLPRAELHLHLVGALRPSQLHGASLPATRRPDAPLDYSDVGDFFARHKSFARSIPDAPSLTRATTRVLENAVDTGSRHIELSINGTEFEDGPLEMAQILDAIGVAFAQIRQRLGVTGGVIVAMDRDRGPAAAFATIDAALAARERGVPVLGIGNDGFPSLPLSEFAAPFQYARERGLRTTAHANKPIDVVHALDLRLDRIDHAWELQGERALQQRLAQSGTPVTMAITSCLLMLPGRFPTAASFPFDELRRAGVAVTLNCDDAAMFFTDSAREYQLAAETYDYNDSTLADIALASLHAAWIDEDRDGRLRAWRAEADALVADPRHPQIGARPL